MPGNKHRRERSSGSSREAKNLDDFQPSVPARRRTNSGTPTLDRLFLRYGPPLSSETSHMPRSSNRGTSSHDAPFLPRQHQDRMKKRHEHARRLTRDQQLPEIRVKTRSKRFAQGASFHPMDSFNSYQNHLQMLYLLQYARSRLPKQSRRFQALRIAQTFDQAPSDLTAASSSAGPLVPLVFDGRDAGTPCFFFVKYGKCLRGEHCRYSHSPHSRLICDKYLKKQCYSSSCTQRHETDPNLLPHCVHYLHGRCFVKECPYVHQLADGGICVDFQNGNCESSLTCNKVHTFVCAEYYNSQGFCQKQARCPFQHPLVLESLEVTSLARRNQQSMLEAEGSLPAPKQSTPCFYFLNGSCKFGDKCFFLHTPQVAKPEIVVKTYEEYEFQDQ